MSELHIDAVQAVGVASATLVNIELTDGRGDPVVGYVDLTDIVMVLPTVVTTDENGQVVVDLIPNSEIVPGNTCYTVRMADKQFLIQKSGATQNLFQALVIDPGDLDPLPGSDFLTKANNLSDVQSASESRDNLELGDSAVRDVGQVAGTVAAGDDPRFAENADALQAHIDDPDDAHDASAISVVPFATITSTDVQAALEEVYSEASGAVAAEDVSFIPSGDIVATDVQAAIEEVDAELHSHETDATDAHDASAVSVVPFATIAATDVQAALEEVFNEASGSPAAVDVTFTPTGDIAATDVQAAIVEVDGELHAHEADTTDAHDASAISVVPSGDLSSTNVQSALTELQGDIDADEAALAAHLADTTDAHDASAISVVPFATIAATNVQDALAEIVAESGGTPTASSVSFTPTGDIVATNVQTAIVEVDTELHAHETKTPGAHAATAISFSPASGIAATNVQTAIVEAKTDAQADVTTHITNPTGAHAGTAISFSPTGTISATNVQNAIAEVATDADASYVPKVGSYAGAATNVFTTDVTGDTQRRFIQGADGRATWGPGNAVGDITQARAITSGLPRLSSTGALEAVVTQTDQVSNPTASNFTYTNTFTTAAAGTLTCRGAQGTMTAAGAGGSPSNSASMFSGLRGNGTSSGTITVAGKLIGVEGIASAGTGGTASEVTAMYANFTSSSGTVTTQRGVHTAAMAGGTTTANRIGVEIGAVQGGTTSNVSLKVGSGATYTAWLAPDNNITTESGGIVFGLSADTNLFRSAANQLKTDDSLWIAGQAGIGIVPSASAALTLPTGTAPAQGILFDGDVNLYRSAANILTTDDTFTSGNLIQAALSTTAGGFRHGATGPIEVAGSGTPEAVVTAPIGSTFHRTDGAAGTSLYIKESGAGNTGWSDIPAASGLTAHLADTVDAHDASAISLTSVPHLTATEVQAGIAALPKGALGRNITVGADQISAVSVTMNGPNITFTADATRLYRVFMNLTITQTATDQWDLHLRENGVTLGAASRFFSATGFGAFNWQGQILYTPTSGVKTLGAQALHLAGANNAQFFNLSTLTFLLEDIGLR